MQKLFPKPLKCLFAIITLYLTVFLVIEPERCLGAAKEAFSLCQNTIIPSFLPFFVCSGLLSALGFSRLCSVFLSPVMRPLFHLPGSSALAFFLGLVSGYPMGAVVATDLYERGECTKPEAERMTAFCNNSGPIFVLGVVGGGYLKSEVLGWYLYIAHILAALMVGVLFRLYRGKEERKNILPPHSTLKKENMVSSLGGIIDSSVFSILKICGFVVFFAVVASALPKGKHLPFLYPIVEITGGLNLLCGTTMDFTTKLSLVSFFLAFSGLSVVFQVSSIIAPRGLSILPYLLGKLLQGGLAAVIVRILLRLFPVDMGAFLPDFVPYHPLVSPLGTFLVSIILVLSCMLLLVVSMLIVDFFEKRRNSSGRRKASWQ